MNSLNHNRRVILLHVSFWCVYLSFFFYNISSRPPRGMEQDLATAFWRTAFHVAFNMIAAYINYFIFLPRFLEKHRKIGRYLLEFLIPFILITTIRVHLQRYMVDGYTYTEHYFYSNIYIVQMSATSLFVVVFVGMLRFAEDWFMLEAKKKELENEKLTAELSFLKEQINPHFLFNTLNNLYYLAYTKSDNTTEVIAKLSQMMRYMIYESNYQQVELGKEIEYMQNYVSLERLRLTDQIPIEFKVEGSPSGIKVAPLILITFLENAFKHGVNANNKNAWVNLSIKVDGKNCFYTVENSKAAGAKVNGKTNGVHLDRGSKSGIGLQNVRRRLELTYPDKYELDVKDLADRYYVKLKLVLN
ncbi:MAG TPA: histidine kinase [Cyclobacteriaceae bacterium]|nr:histidine kinase [Cyclobacteriaceae bacterium]